MEFVISRGILERYIGSGPVVAIPAGVTKIGNGAFRGCESLTSVTIPVGVTEIGDWAFAYCHHLTSVFIPAGVTTIGEQAFIGCSGLADADGFVVVNRQLFEYCGMGGEVTIPDGVTRIGVWAFFGRYRLTSVTIPAGVATIGEEAFFDCTSLTSVAIQEGVTSIEKLAFWGCTSLSEVTIPEGVMRIGDGAFGDCPALTVVCREGSAAQGYCEEKRLRYIFDYQREAFRGTVPAGVERLSAPFMADEEGPYVFVSYSHRDRDSVFPVIKGLFESGWRVWYDEGLTIGDRYDETLEAHVRGCAAFLLFVTSNSLASAYIRRNEVPWALSSRKPIVRCALEGGATYEIAGAPASPTVGPEGIDGALGSIPGLGKGERRAARGISVAVDPAARASAGGSVALCLYSCDGEATARSVMLEASRAGCALRDGVREEAECKDLEGCACLVAFIDEAFLEDERLAGILAERRRQGGDVALCQVGEVDEDNLPKGLEGLGETQWLHFDHGIGADAVSKLARHLQRRGCRDASVIPGFESETRDGGIAILRYVGTAEEPRLEATYGGLPVTVIAERAFQNCLGLRRLEIPVGVKRIEGYAFRGCTNLTSLTIPEGVATIGRSAFSGCSALTSVTISEGVPTIGDSASIPEGVATIEDWAFGWCTSLTSVTIPAGVATIGESAFSGCSGLTSVTIPVGVTTIGRSAFSGCSGLTSVTIPKGVTTIGESAFRDCTSLSDVTISEGVTEIGRSAFWGCTSLFEVTIPESVTEIGEWAFRGCKSLSSVSIPGGVTEIGVWAFSGCEGLVATCVPGSYAWKFCKKRGISIRL